MSHPPPDPVDRALISELAGEIARSAERPKLAAYFAGNGAPPPRVVWQPSEDDVRHEPLRFLVGFWQMHSAGGRLPGVDMVEPFALKPALGYIMLLDVLDDGWDYRYRLYGTNIAQRLGQDLTGRRTSDISKRAFTGTFYIAAYRAVLERRAPLFTVSASPRYVAAVDWWRLALPLAAPDGAVTRLLVGNVPGDWRSTREPPAP
ncbi:MAG: PAS domain-containing protein [Alphaproteobacteria bacterium]|nr:PAS domain-containing protein [Alphaproteobacteria bacterium]